MKFAHRYKLLKPFPGHDVGDEISWHGADQRFYFWQIRRSNLELSRRDFDGARFTVDQVQDAEWFKPLDTLREFIPAFPSRKKLEDYVDLSPQCRLVDDVDECRAINALINDPGFQGRLYDFYREQYNEFHGITVV